MNLKCPLFSLIAKIHCRKSNKESEDLSRGNKDRRFLEQNTGKNIDHFQYST